MQLVKGLLASGLLLLCHTSQAANNEAIRVIIKYKKAPLTLPDIKALSSQKAQLPVNQIQAIAGGAYTITFTSPSMVTRSGLQDKAELVLARLRQDPNVMYAVKDRVGHFKPLPAPIPQLIADKTDDPLLQHAIQWDEFGAPAGVILESAPGTNDGAWAYTTGSAYPPVVVAVLDTGIEPHDSLMHSVFQDAEGAIWGWNFAGNNNNLSDETRSYHGTHVAGTIAGYGDVMIGMGKDLKILPVKIPDETGLFYESAVINALYWSVGGDVPGAPHNPHPAKVLNMSFGIDERPGKEIDHCDEALQEALFYVRKQGAVLVVAAGNDNRWEHYNAPAVCNSTIKVASTGPQGLRAYYSNYGPSITLAAPGGEMGRKQDGILSTVKPGAGYKGSGYDFFQGTSMASPHVASVAGLIFAISPTKPSPQTVEQILHATTHNFGKSDSSEKACDEIKPCGHGILDARMAARVASEGMITLLSAPKKDQTPNAKGFDESPWEKLPTSKLHGGNKALPHVYQGPDGKIYAESGTSTYRLRDTYRHCGIVGFDGIACRN